jgi:hypothetical protein
LKIPPRLRRAQPVTLALGAGLLIAPAFSSSPLPVLPKVKGAPEIQRADSAERRPITLDQVPPGALVPQGPPPALTILGTGDVVGYLEPCG